MAQLPFLPSPYPDELLYSICARYHLFSASPSQKQTLLDLFGCASASAIYDLPCRLSALSSRLPPNTANTPERLLRHHTMFSLYEPFLPKARAHRIAAMMIGSDKGDRIHGAIGIRASSVHGLERLRLCRDCVESDIETYGEPFWHRSHQIPGVLLCHNHATPLANSNVVVFSQNNKHRFVAARQGEIGPTEYRNVHCRDRHHELAQMAHMLLSNQYPILGLKALHSRYGNVLQRRQFVTPGGHIVQHRLQREFTEFYGNEFLELVGCQFNPTHTDNWLSMLVRSARKATHPLRHLLLMGFLGTTPDDILLHPGDPYDPFGSGPWPCLNATASHFMKPTIRSCEIKRNSETGAPVGTFACACGFIYSRTGPDTAKEDRFRISRMIRFGGVWENALLHYFEIEKKSLRITARFLHVDPRTVIKHFARLRNGCGSEKESHDVLIGNQVQRDEWQRLHEDNPTLSRTELRKLAPAIYTKLYRHDRSWLFATEPLPLPGARTTPQRVNWDARDRELSEEVRKATMALSHRENKNSHITISMIGKATGRLALLQQHLGKLPKTRAILSALNSDGKLGEV